MTTPSPSLPRDIATLLRPALSGLTATVTSEVRRGVPTFADEGYTGAVSDAAERAIRHFLDRIDDPSTETEPFVKYFHDLGVRDLHTERPIIEPLRAAYRLGARAAWRHAARLVHDSGVASSTLCQLGEAVFAYMDELSSLSFAGHTQSQVRHADSIERHRKELLAILVSAEHPVPATTIARLAQAARWQVPRRIAAIAIEPRSDTVAPPAHAFGNRVLADVNTASPFLLVGEDDLVVLNELTAAVPGTRAAIGPPVALRHAGESLRWARHTLRLVQCGILPNVEVTWFDRQLSTLWMLDDPMVVAEMVERALAPLNGINSRQRTKLSDTLLLALETGRDIGRMADVLGVHAQTVRYRLRQLDKLFGRQLAERETRFAIELALRAERTLRPVG
ncbi:helix-turn-helix domain-containing protein [Haloechinothrix salitolerans]|uniref:Helix-turn-helix domain-containing protein n=1 Tax=Haloechinothrix salitolerans TaxID=926830 RepID=A0ABW2C7X5_9PSEU